MCVCVCLDAQEFAFYLNSFRVLKSKCIETIQSFELIENKTEKKKKWANFIECKNEE